MISDKEIEREFKLVSESNILQAKSQADIIKELLERISDLEEKWKIKQQ